LTADIPPLQTFYVYLTSGCNCACRHCWIVPKAPGENIVLDPLVLRRAIKQALPLGLQSLKWTGGEPTLHPDLPRLLGTQKEFGLTASLETNGLLVDSQLANLLHDTGVTRVSVSLDGAQAATHDAIRGIVGGFARTCAGIRTLIESGYRPELILTLQRSNVGELDDYLALAVSLGAGSVKLNVMQPLLRGAELAALGESLTVTEVLELARRLEQEWRVRCAVPVILDVPLAFRSLRAFLDGTAGGVCGISHILGLLPNGDYALCGIGSHIGELVMGKVHEVDLAGLWHSHPLLVRLRVGLPGELRGICGVCLMKAACRGSCVAANYHQSADLFAPYWFCQAAADAGLFPASRRAGAQLA
jgi:SynChlorMet cassette radical SAM/SPASM protein ScmF